MTIWIVAICFIYAVLMTLLATRAYNRGFRDGYSWSRYRAFRIDKYFEIPKPMRKKHYHAHWLVGNSHTLN